MKRVRRPLRALRVVVFQEGDWLCAQCLDHDLAVQARTLEKLYDQLSRMIVGHIAVRREHGRRPFEDLQPAPKKYWDMFEHSRIPLPTQMFRVRNYPSNFPAPKVRVAVPIAASK